MKMADKSGSLQMLAMSAQHQQVQHSLANLGLSGFTQPNIRNPGKPASFQLVL